MKPLRSGESEKQQARREMEEEGHLARLEAEKEKETKALAVKIAAAKERRLMESRNRGTKQLGEADDADDDLSAWVQKSRVIEDKRKKEEKRKAEELARKLAEQDEDAEEDESDDDGDMFGGGGNKRKSGGGGGGGGGYSSKELAGLKVRHGADEVMEGETMILTLKDSSILDDARTGINDDTDQLENVLLAEDKRRKKAKMASTKKSTTPFAEEEEEAAGSKKLLSKYDEKEEEDLLTLDGSGGLDEAEQRRKEDIRRKLAASLGGAPVGAKEQSAQVEKKGLADFMTAAEVAEAAAAKGFNKPKKRRKKKLREKKVDAAELEADALAPASNELGSRRRREEGGSAVAAAAAAEKAEKDDRYVHSMNKAKLKTDEKILAEMAGDLDEEMGGGGADEEDDELERALARSRRLAAKGTSKGQDAVVAAVAERREKDGPLAQQAAGKEGIVGLGDGVVFSDMQEFIHGISVDDRRASAGAGAAAAAGPSGGDDDDDDDGGMPPPPPPPPPGGGGGGDDMDVDGDAEDHDGMPPPPPPPPSSFSLNPKDDNQRSSNLGGIGDGSTASKGLAATLALLKDTGKLNENEMWDGRTNDKKKLALTGAREAADLSSGEWEGHKFDFRLDKFDEFGRKMTPKEAFRELCHRFHGIEPGKAKKEKRLKAYQEEVKAKKMAEGDTPLASMEKMKQVQKMQASPFVVLSGTVRAGQTSDPTSRYATTGDQDDDEGGGKKSSLGAALDALPEIRGKKKVEFMMKKR
jgi:U4/U6.U5 tri-snRNP-associated protein 1